MTLQFSVLNESVTLADFTLQKNFTHIFTQADVDLVILKKLYIDVMPAGCTVAVIDVFDMIYIFTQSHNPPCGASHQQTFLRSLLFRLKLT